LNIRENTQPHWDCLAYDRGLIPLEEGSYDEAKYAEALENFEISSKKDPNYASAWLLKGFCFLSLERYDEAKESFKRAISLYNQPNWYYL
jgi:tetratricopeptide (TPR) repeat protein